MTAPDRLKMRYAPESITGVELQQSKVLRGGSDWGRALGWLVFSVALAISPAAVLAAWGWLL